MLFIANFVLILVVFLLFFSLCFGQISSLAIFRWLTATSDRNAKSCNCIPSNYCLPQLLSITPRFWPSKPLAGLGRNWNHYLLTMLIWNCRDSMPLSAAFWQRSPGIVETQHLYPLCHGPRRAIKVGFFGLINSIICSLYLVFHSRVCTEFVIVFIGNPFEMRLLNLRINFYLLRTSCPQQKTTKLRTKMIEFLLLKKYSNSFIQNLK